MLNKFPIKLLFVLMLVMTITVAGMSGSIKAQGSNYNSLSNFQEIIYLIKNFYVEDIGIETLIDGAIQGMIEKLDPYSSYLSPNEYEEMQLEFDGTFGGIGIVITTREGKLTIISPIKGTPGARADLQAGDVIKEIDGKATEKMSQKKAVDMMRGEPGTEVVLTIKRENVMEPLQVKIVRAVIEIPYVEHEMKGDNIGYISVSQFAKDVGEKVNDSISKLKAQGAGGIILDLRSNPGGLLREAVKVASNFIKKGTVVTVKQRNGQNQVFKVKNNIDSVNLPLIVMINKGSASASEIVAGAVKDYNRGKLVGTRSFGKGTVQTVVPLNDGSALRLTTARYYTPDGNFIHEEGIEPDINVEYDSETEQDEQLLKAIDLMESFIHVEEVIKKKAG